MNKEMSKVSEAEIEQVLTLREKFGSQVQVYIPRHVRNNIEPTNHYEERIRSWLASSHKSYGSDHFLAKLHLTNQTEFFAPV